MSRKKMAEILGIDDDQEVIDAPDGSWEEVENEEQIKLPPPKETLPAIVEETNLSDEEQDFQRARKNFKDIIETGKEALENLMVVAGEEESPRSFEVIAKMLETLTTTVERSYGIHDQRKKTVGDIVVQQPINVDKAVFVGTAADMLRKIKSEEDGSGS